MAEIDYAELFRQVAAEKPVQKQISKATEVLLRKTEKNWERFCEEVLKIHKPYELLLRLNDPPATNGAGMISTFLKWRLDQGSIKCESSLCLEFKYFQYMFVRRAEDRLRQPVNEQVHNRINRLVAEYGLNRGGKAKQVVSSADFLHILQGMWKWKDYKPDRVLVQSMFMSKLMAYTASRPGALLESHAYCDEGLEYKDVALILVRLPSGIGKFVLEVTMNKYKGKREKNEPITFAVHEVPGSPILCPVLDFITLALIDQAFDFVQSPEDLYQLQVPNSLDYLHVPFKKEFLNIPICRQVQRGGKTDPSKPLAVASFNYALEMGCGAAGFKEKPTSYWLRRGAANALDGNVSSAQRNLVMGHHNSSIFEKYYADRRIKADTQSYFLKTSPEEELREVLRRIERNPAAPSLSEKGIKLKLGSDPELDALSKKRDGIRAKIQASGNKLKDSKEYSEVKTAYLKRRAIVMRGAKKKSRALFFVDAGREEIQRQILGEGPSQFLEPGRAFQSLDHEALVGAIIDGSNTEYSRVDMIKQLLRMCYDSSSKPPKVTLEPEKSTMDYDQGAPKLHCPFCIRSYQYASNLKRHVIADHIPESEITPVAPFACPSIGCDFKFGGIDHFKNHCAIIHNLFLPASHSKIPLW